MHERQDDRRAGNFPGMSEGEDQHDPCEAAGMSQSPTRSSLSLECKNSCTYKSLHIMTKAIVNPKARREMECVNAREVSRVEGIVPRNRIKSPSKVGTKRMQMPASD